jgi:hypothetical protein
VFPPGKEASRGRRHSVSSRLSGQRACGLASVDVITSPEVGPNKGCSVELSSDSGSSGSDPK